MSSYLLCTRRIAVAAAACWTLFAIGTPAASAEPSTHARGSPRSSARCAAPTTAVAFGSTANSRTAICKSPAGAYGYHGVRISDGATLIAAVTASNDGSFVAQKDGVTYTVTSNALTLSDASGTIRSEPMVSYHGPKTTKAPASTAQSPAAKPQAPAATPAAPSSTAPLPAPLPAEVGGGRTH